MSIRNAQARREARGVATFRLLDVELFPRFNPIFTLVNGAAVLHPEIEPELGRIVAEKAPRLVVGSFWGNQHFFFSTANLPRRLDLVLPFAPELPRDPQAEIVPYDVFHNFVGAHFAHGDLMIAALRRVTDAPIYLAPAPAPVEDLAAIPTGSSSKQIDALVAEHGAAPALLRRKFWLLTEAVHEERAAAAGVKTLPTPPETLDEAGFRRPEYFSTDWIHGNTLYGEAVLQQFDALLAQD